MTPTVIWCRHPIVTLLYFEPLWVISRYLLLMAIWSHFWRYVTSVSHYVVNGFDWCGRRTTITSYQRLASLIHSRLLKLDHLSKIRRMTLIYHLVKISWHTDEVCIFLRKVLFFLLEGWTLLFKHLKLSDENLKGEKSVPRELCISAATRSPLTQVARFTRLEWIGPNSRSLAFELYFENHLE